MSHMVKCIYCQSTFNRDKEAFVQISPRRYAHEDCAKIHYVEKSKEEIDYEAQISRKVGKQ